MRHLWTMMLLFSLACAPMEFDEVVEEVVDEEEEVSAPDGPGDVGPPEADTLPVLCRMQLNCDTIGDGFRCRWYELPGEDQKCGVAAYGNMDGSRPRRYCYNLNGGRGTPAPRCCTDVFWRNIRGVCRRVCVSGQNVTDDFNVWHLPSCGELRPPPNPMPMPPLWPPFPGQGRPGVDPVM